MRVNFSDCLLVWRSRFAEISTTICTRGIFTVFTDKLLKVSVLVCCGSKSRTAAGTPALVVQVVAWRSGSVVGLDQRS